MLFFDMYVSLIDKKYDNFCNLYNFKKKDIKPYKTFFELEGRKYSRYAFYLGIFDENYTYKYDIKDNLKIICWVWSKDIIAMKKPKR